MTMLTDIRLALRGFAKAPGFALLAILILALGLGASATIFGLLDAAVLRPLPFAEPDRLVRVHLLAREDRAAPPNRMTWSYPKFELFRREAKSFTAVAGYEGPTSLNLAGPDGAERLAAEQVGGAYFQILGLQAAVGRLFDPSFDATPGEPAVVVLGHQFWTTRFGGRPEVVGTDLRLNDRALRVIGVAPAGFRGLTGGADLFIPITLAPLFEYDEILTETGNHWFDVVGHLAPGVSLAAADQEAGQIGAIVDRQYRFPEQVAPWSAGLSRLAESRIDPGLRRSVWLLAGAVGLVLLIGCVNLTGLLLARAAARRREIGVRLALGASRGRIVRQVLAETLLLALGGWGLGLLGGSFAIRGLATALGGQVRGGAGSFFDPSMVRLDARVAGFALALALLAALVSAILPSIQSSRPGLADTLKESAAGRARRVGIQQLLVVGEVALALVLLAGAGLLTRSFLRLNGLDPGFEPAGVLTMRYAAADGDLARRDPPAFRWAAVERLAALPGVKSASIALCPPLTERCSGSVVARADERAFGRGESAIRIGLHPVTPDHFQTLGIPVLRGRTFTSFDAPGTPRVVILNETAARRLFPGQDPIGHRMSAATFYFAGGDSTAEVIGIVKDVRYGAYDAEPAPDLYYPISYLRAFGSAGTIFIRAEGDPARLTDLVRAELKLTDPNLPVFRVMTMEQLGGAALARPRFAATLLGGFAAAALLLAAMGLYAVLAFGVARQSRELGVRMALGATELRVLGGVIRQGLVLAGAGVVLGVLAALALQRLIAGLLYGVRGNDPVTLFTVAGLMLGTAALAAFIPARRATRADPLVALRSE
jgi:putative ABC transport system permease protein